MAPNTDKEEAILEAALDLFVERGFHGTAVPAVAERAGVGAGTIYRYFANKEALVNALWRKWKLAVLTQAMGSFASDLPLREQFRTYFREMSRFALEHPNAIAFLELHHHASYLDDESRAMEESSYVLAGQVIGRAQEAGLFKPIDPELAMALVYGAFQGVVRAGRDGRLTLDSDTMHAAEEWCWSSLTE